MHRILQVEGENGERRKQRSAQYHAIPRLKAKASNQDRGSPMTANGFLADMKQLDITCSHSRTRMSNDNPFCESGFPALKYRPDYPGKLAGTSHARYWCYGDYNWHSHSHNHSGLNGYTPEPVFTGSFTEIATIKQAALDARYKKTPERFVKGRPIVKQPPVEVCIYPITEDELAEGVADKLNFPILAAAGYDQLHVN